MEGSLNTVASTSAAVAATRSRRRKVAHLAACLRGLTPDALPIGVAYLSGYLPQGRIGVGPALLRKAASVGAAGDSTLSLRAVDQRLTDLAAMHGAGATQRKTQALGAIFALASESGQRFLAQLLLGELRQGALEGVMADAVADAFALTPERVRRAYMLAGDLAAVAVAAQQHGQVGVDRFRLRLLQPLKPMLAQSAEDVTDVFDAAESSVLEYKLDGIRIQAHKDGKQVRLFTRQLNDVSASIPELVDTIAALPCRQVVLDGEALVLTADGRPLPFQYSMRRLGNRLDIARLRTEMPVRGCFFDLLLLDGAEVFDQPLLQREQMLDDLLPHDHIVPRLLTTNSADATSFMQRALQAGHEGIMAKAPASSYEAGHRGNAWLKVKHHHTLDLVILAAEWGSGRRRQWLSNLHLGARDPASGGFVMLGKTFKGLTDAQLAWQTERLQQLAVAREGAVVYVAPELVVEIAFNEVQSSQHYPGGMALRFARVKRFRPDKQAHNADSVETVREIFLQRLNSTLE